MMKAFILGTVFFLAALIVKPVGVSTQFSVLSGIIHKTIDPDVITEDSEKETGYASSNAYYDRNDGKLAKSIEDPLHYDFVFVLAIPFGAFLAYLATGKRRNMLDGTVESCERQSAETQGCKIGVIPGEKKNVGKRYLPSFIGGFLLLYGARMADGCTSGHMMSGMMQGSVSGYLFAGAVFAVAIPTAIVIGIRRKAKGGMR